MPDLATPPGGPSLATSRGQGQGIVRWVGVSLAFFVVAALLSGCWGDDSRAFPRSTMPLDADGVVEPTCPNHHATLATFTGMTPPEAGAVLANTPADPAAVELAALPPVQRMQQAISRQLAGSSAVVDFVCEAGAKAHTYTRAEGTTASDGVHLRIANLTGHPLVFSYDHAGGGGGREVPPGETGVVVLAQPGPSGSAAGIALER